MQISKEEVHILSSKALVPNPRTFPEQRTASKLRFKVRLACPEDDLYQYTYPREVEMGLIMTTDTVVNNLKMEQKKFWREHHMSCFSKCLSCLLEKVKLITGRMFRIRVASGALWHVVAFLEEGGVVLREENLPFGCLILLPSGRVIDSKDQPLSGWGGGDYCARLLRTWSSSAVHRVRLLAARTLLLTCLISGCSSSRSQALLYNTHFIQTEHQTRSTTTTTRSCSTTPKLNPKFHIRFFWEQKQLGDKF